MSSEDGDIVDLLMKRWSRELHREARDDELESLLVRATHEIVRLRESCGDFSVKIRQRFALQIKGFWRLFEKASKQRLKSRRLV